MKWLFLALLLPQAAFATCTKEITVLEVFKRSNPNPFKKVLEPERVGETLKLKISCKLYSEVSTGDTLHNPDEEVSSFRLFSGDGGVIERKNYKILSK